MFAKTLHDWAWAMTHSGFYAFAGGWERQGPKFRPAGAGPRGVWLAMMVWLLLFASGLRCVDAAVEYPVFGLNFSPYVRGQDPNRGVIVSREQIRQRLRIIAPHTRWIRTYGTTHGLAKAGHLAHRKGLKAAVGAWLGPVVAANEAEIRKLIAMGRKGQLDIAIVGSEVLQRGDLTPRQLLSYIHRVKTALPNLPVAYADIHQQWLDHPEIIAAVDIVLFHHYGYWEGLEVGQAVTALHQRYLALRDMAAGKPVWVGESGWPSCGETRGDAVPSLANANAYFLNFVSWAEANAVNYLYFEAFDERWKADYEGPQGACWGVWDNRGRLKPGMQAVFEGQRVSDHWSQPAKPPVTSPVIPPGNPTLEFTWVPPIGSEADLLGRALNVKPADYRVAVYIRVGEGWWTKPYDFSPLTPLGSDGSWSCDITTGGDDPRATAIKAYLVPAGYSPPIILGDAKLPATLDQNAVAWIEVSR